MQNLEDLIVIIHVDKCSCLEALCEPIFLHLVYKLHGLKIVGMGGEGENNKVSLNKNYLEQEKCYHK